MSLEIIFYKSVETEIEQILFFLFNKQYIINVKL